MVGLGKDGDGGGGILWPNIFMIGSFGKYRTQQRVTLLTCTNNEGKSKMLYKNAIYELMVYSIKGW